MPELLTSPDPQPARPRTGLASWLPALGVLLVALVLIGAAGASTEKSAFALRFVACALALGSILLWPRLELGTTGAATNGALRSDTETETDLDQTTGDEPGAVRTDAAPSDSTSRWPVPLWQAMAAVLIVGIGVRLLVAITEPMHYDESYTVAQYSSKSFATILSTYDAPNNHLLHSVLVKVCLVLFGSSEFSIRLPAFLAGVATIPATAWLGTRLASPRVGVLAAALVAVSPPLIVYAAMARGYSITILAFVLLLAIGHRLATDEDRPRRLWLAFAFVSAVSIATVPTGAMGVTAAWVWTVVLFAMRRRLTPAIIGRLALATVVVAASGVQLYLPIRDQPGFDFTANGTTVEQLRHEAFAAWSAGWGKAVGSVILVLAGVGLFAARREWRSQPMAIALLVVPCVVPLFTLLLDQVPPFIRTYIFLVPLLLVLTAVGAAWLLGFAERRLAPHLAELLVPTLAIVVLVPVLFIGARPEAWDLDPRRVADPSDVIAKIKTWAPGVPVMVPGYTQPSYSFYATRDSLTYPAVSTMNPTEAPLAVLPVTPPGDFDSFLALAPLTRDQVEIVRTVKIDRNTLYLLRWKPGAAPTPAPG